MCNRNHSNGSSNDDGDNRIVFDGICRKRLSFNLNVDVYVHVYVLYGVSGYIEKCLFYYMIEGMGYRSNTSTHTHTTKTICQIWQRRKQNRKNECDKGENNEHNATTFAPKPFVFISIKRNDNSYFIDNHILRLRLRCMVRRHVASNRMVEWL